MKLTITIKELTGEDAVDILGNDAENIVRELNEPIESKEEKWNERQWREVYRRKGIGECDSPQWLLNGCPVIIDGKECGGKEWEVTSDCWAYCKKCSVGIHTNFPFTNSGELVSDLTPYDQKHR